MRAGQAPEGEVDSAKGGRPEETDCGTVTISEEVMVRVLSRRDRLAGQAACGKARND
ncbi:MAG: hypothetical protein LBT40_14235 [Deltaproteobacteria bacterium]|nr:hypothetical protein [Deltaproteobacteria bacterium]